MFEYVTFARIRICPDGHVKLGSCSGPVVRLASTRPLLDWNEPPVLTEPAAVAFVVRCPPLLRHAYVAVASAVRVYVMFSSPRPASSQLTNGPTVVDGRGR